MKKLYSLLAILFIMHVLNAQQVDSIFFHLYTDSLKKGTYNYINVDGKLSNGRWQPLTSNEIEFSSSACSFSGNELIVPADFAMEKLRIKAVLRKRPSVWIEREIWIKQRPDPELPPENTPTPKKRRGN